MAVVDKPTLKSYFQTGDRPTEANFIDLIDSLELITDASGAFFAQGGDAFGANAVIGTTDNFSLSFLTNNSIALSFDASQNATFYGKINSLSSISGASTYTLTNVSTTVNIPTITYDANSNLKEGDIVSGTGIPSGAVVMLIVSSTSAAIYPYPTATNTGLTLTANPMNPSALLSNTFSGASGTSNVGLSISSTFSNASTINNRALDVYALGGYGMRLMSNSEYQLLLGFQSQNSTTSVWGIGVGNITQRGNLSFYSDSTATNRVLTLTPTSVNFNVGLLNAPTSGLSIIATTASSGTFGTNFRTSDNNIAHTAGTATIAGFNYGNGTTFAPASGTGNLVYLGFYPTLNQTGTANGTVRGIYYNPTLTSVLGSHYAIEATSGQMVMPLGSISAPTYTFGSQTNSGMFYHSAENAIGFSFGGSRVMTVNNSVLYMYGQIVATDVGQFGNFLYVNTGPGGGVGGTISVVSQWSGENGYVLKANASDYTGNPYVYNNSAGTTLFQVNSSGDIITNSTTAATSTTTGALIVAGGVGISGDIYSGKDVYFSSSAHIKTVNAGDVLVFQTVGGAVANDGISFSKTASITSSSGPNGVVYISANFQPTSGNSTYTNISIAGLINQTGTASGTVRGIYYNPTITSVLGEHYFLNATSGKVYLSGSIGSISATFNITNAVTTNGSKSITYDSNTQVKPGDIIIGTGISSGTTIAYVISATSAMLSANATASGTITATVTPSYVGTYLNHTLTGSVNSSQYGLYVNPYFNNISANNRSLIINHSYSAGASSSAVEIISGPTENSLLFTGDTTGSSQYKFGIGQGGIVTNGYFYFAKGPSMIWEVSSSTHFVFSSSVLVQGGGATTTFKMNGGGGASSTNLSAYRLMHGGFQAGVLTYTTGTFNILSLGGNNDGAVNQAFQPSSGSGNYTIINLDPVLNQTGTANGTVRGIYYSPTVTSVLGIHNAIETTNGNIVFGGTTSLSLNGNLQFKGSSRVITDDNGNKLIAFPATVAGAVNYLQISNSVTGSLVGISALGSDSNIGLVISPKGTGKVAINAATTNASTDSILTLSNTTTAGGDSTLSHYNSALSNTSNRSVIRLVQGNTNNAATCNTYLWGQSTNIIPSSEQTKFGVDVMIAGTRTNMFSIDGNSMIAGSAASTLSVGTNSVAAKFYVVGSTTYDDVAIFENYTVNNRLQLRNFTESSVSNTNEFYFYFKNSASSSVSTNRIYTKMSNTTAGSETGYFAIYGHDAGTSAIRFAIDGGQLKLNNTYILDQGGVNYYSALESTAANELRVGSGFTGGVRIQNKFGLGVTPAAVQTGGAQTAGSSFGTTEQSMLQTVYNAMRTFGLLT